jgi:hypothetical protein
MKKCPNCEKTFDDAMKFCQVDGTPLVDDVPEVDPYKTMVAGKAEIAAAMASLPSDPQPEEDVLQIPPVEHDPKKTMYASEDEIRNAMAEVDQPVMDIPPIGEPAPPAFIDSSVSRAKDQEDPGFSKTTPPIPSPFGGPKADSFEPSAPAFSPPDPEPPSFARAEPPSPSFNPFNEPASELNGLRRRRRKTTAGKKKKCKILSTSPEATCLPQVRTKFCRSYRLCLASYLFAVILPRSRASWR